MGKSMDFSEGIKLIQAAHADASAIIEKWRELISAPGELTFSVKNLDGTTETITIPTIREAINRYLGGTFEQITLTDGTASITMRLNESGDVELVRPDGSGSNLIVDNVIVTRIIGEGGDLPISGNVSFSGGTIQDASVTLLRATSGDVRNATFSGVTTLSGSSRIQGSLVVKSVTTDSLNIGKIQYSKQVVHFGVEGIRASELSGPTNGDIWTGNVSVLEASGIRAVPTWADCTYTPGSLTSPEDQIHIYWGSPDIGDVMVANTSGGYSFNASFAAAWPYKMYERVPGGYRIRWLPLDGDVGRIHYARTGNSLSGEAVTHIEVTTAPTGIDPHIVDIASVNKYSCRRFMAAYGEETAPLSRITHHILYKV